jgi:hypothetical protein
MRAATLTRRKSTMNFLPFASAAVAMSLAAVYAPAAGAAEVSRTDLVEAATACTSTAPGDNLRNNVAGVRNIGESDIYITCAIAGDPNVGPTASGASFISVRVYNNSVSNHNIQCSLYGGSGNGSSTTTQGASTQIQNIKPNDNKWFYFYPSSLPGSPTEIANATVICKAPQNVGVYYVYRDYIDTVGM